MNKSKLLLILRIAVSLLLLALLLWLARESLAKIWQLLSSIRVSIFILACLTFLSTVIFLAWRLKIILAAQNAFVSLASLFSLTLIGYFFTNFMPTSVGGDLVKGYYISKKTGTKLNSYTAVLFDRIVGVFSFALIASTALLIMRNEIEHKLVIWGIVLLLACCGIFISILLNRGWAKKIGNFMGLARLLRASKLESKLKQAYEAMSIYVNQKQRLVQTLLLSLISQLITFLSIYLLSISLGAEVPFKVILLVMPIIVALCMLPVTMNGLGLREWAFVLFLRSSIGDAAALSLSLLYLAMFLLSSLIGGVIYLFWR